MADFLSELKSLFAETFGLDVETYTSLTTVEGEFGFVTKDGGLMSVIALRGHLRIVGAEELRFLTRQLLSLLGSTLGANEGHIVDIVFSSDPSDTPEEIRRRLESGARTARRLELELADLFDERARHLPAFTCAEQCWAVVWTTPAGLPPSARRRAAREQRRFVRSLQTPPELTRDVQNPFARNRYLVDTHQSTVKTLVQELKAFGFDVELLTLEPACRLIRRESDPEWTTPDWRPVLPGGGVPLPRVRANGAVEAAGCWFPAFGQQLIPRGIDILDARTVRIGDRLYQPFFVDVPQLTEAQRFEKLLQRIRQERLPWRLLVRLCGGARSWLLARRRWLGLLAFAGHQNKLIDAAVTALLRHINEGNVGVKVQMAATTWVKPADHRPQGRSILDQLGMQTAFLASHFQAWGGCTVRQATGHPAKTWASTVPGLTLMNVATRYAAPLSDVLRTLPLFRPATPWRTGILFRSRDGRLFFYQPGSELQGTCIELYFARPGSGKSVMMNANILALLLAPGLRALPFVRVIDIGPSSEGLISLVREALPPARRYEAQFHGARNDARWAINVLDTPLGLRVPPPQKRAFLASFLALLATATGADLPPEGIAEMAGLVIDLAYDHYGDLKAPKPYAPGLEPAVDEALARRGAALPDRPSWWEVVDALFEAGDVPAAVRAQRHAVPLLSDLVSIAQWPQVTHLYGEDMVLKNTSESPVQLFNRVISAVTREWPMLAYPTRVDFGNARVVSLDVAALCGDMTPAGRRQTAIAYMVAMHVLSHDLFMSAEVAASAPAAYRAYHQDRAETVLAEPQRFCLDELHRAAGIPAVIVQIIRRMREGRKENVQIALASQLLSDFSPEMADLATTVFIMEYPSDATADEIRAKFSLSASALEELRVYGTGPTAAGAPFLGVFRTKSGTVAHMLYYTAGPIELWALSTTAEDRVVRQRLYRRFGPPLARSALARAYPGGTIKPELQRRLDGGADAVLDREAVLSELTEEVAALAVRLTTGAPPDDARRAA